MHCTARFGDDEEVSAQKTIRDEEASPAARRAIFRQTGLSVMRNSDSEWQKLGAVEPYWSVLSDPRYRASSLTRDALEDFFESGKQHVEFLFSTIGRHFQTDFRPKRALDFGCGVGRILQPLSTRCDSVTGVDVAESMIALAQERCRAQGLTNVELLRADEDLRNLSGEFDFVHSFIVFQHIPAQKGERILRRLLSLLSDHGVAAIQFSCSDTRSALRRAVNRAQKSLPLVHNLANLAKGRPWGFPYIDMNDYDLNRVIALIHREGCCAGHIIVRILESEGSIGAFLFFRKGPHSGPEAQQSS
ncbi:MAG: class I SAM-dependent methyltransferase [Thermodesulfobacteriota bacterium]